MGDLRRERLERGGDLPEHVAYSGSNSSELETLKDPPGGGSVETVPLWGRPLMRTSGEAGIWFLALEGHVWAENFSERILRV
jgi:hypothetical protein